MPLRLTLSVPEKKDKDGQGKSQKSFLPYLGKPGFVALSKDTKPIELCSCREGDDGTLLVWDRKIRKYLLCSRSDIANKREQV
jgi:hypothetical protein